MSEEKKDGGPAFPHQIGPDFAQNKGMSLRDYFAAKAMQALIPKASKMEYTAKVAYAWADAMLEVREM